MRTVIDFNKMKKGLDEYTRSIVDLVSVQNESLISISSMSREILEWISKYIKKQLESQGSQPTSQEIAEIVNKAISSYKETDKKNLEKINRKIEELNKQSIEQINKKIDDSNKHNMEEFNKIITETNKQNNKELNLYHTQIIQMFKDLIENVNNLNNKVDRLENIIILLQKKEEKEKEITKRTTTTQQSTTQTFVNGLYSSNKKVYVGNILNKDSEGKEDLIIKDKTSQNNEAIKVFKQVEMNGGIFDEANYTIIVTGTITE